MTARRTAPLIEEIRYENASAFLQDLSPVAKLWGDTEVETLYAEWERLDDMLFVSWSIRAQLSRMASHGLIDEEVVEAIEDADADSLRDLVTEAVGTLDRR